MKMKLEDESIIVDNNFNNEENQFSFLNHCVSFDFEE